MAVGTESSTIFIHVIISLSLLLFTSKIFAELFHRIKLPIVLGEILAGIIIGPYALGGLPLFNGEPLVILDETIRHIGELAAIVILFVAGLEITPREFLKGGLSSFTVGALGVIVPFFVGYIVFSLYGLEALETLLIATALTATSIAISIQVLSSLGKMQTKEARLILGAAIVDDILAIAVLSVVLTMVQTGNTTPDIMEITFLILKILGLFVALLVGSVLIVPRILHRERLWKSQGSIEGITTEVLLLAGILVSIAIVTKLLGCGLPSLIFLKDKSKAMRVGIGMISRGEVGLIIAGVGATSGVLSGDVYTAIIVMVAVTTIITPIWLKKVYQKELV